MEYNYILQSKDNLTLLLKDKGISHWNHLTAFVKQLPYGRNTNRTDFSLVFTEEKGTCSSKHAFLKHVADLNNLPNIKLILGIYKMNPINTPKIGNTLDKSNLEYIPEAHCYLRISGEYFDFTSATSNFNRLKNDILFEKHIKPNQVSEFKVNYHKDYIRTWIKDHSIPFSFDEIWKLRELCIENLSD